MMRVDDPYSGSFSQSTPSGRHVQFEAHGECGMGGPTRGSLEISGIASLSMALPCLVLDEESGVVVFQELDMTGTPKVIVHVHRLLEHAARQYALPFGAYIFTKVGRECIGVREEVTNAELELCGQSDNAA